MWNLNMDLELRSYDEQSERGPVEWPDGRFSPAAIRLRATSRIRRVNRANRSMVRMTAIMAANILRKVRRERKTLRISMRRTASHKAN